MDPKIIYSLWTKPFIDKGSALGFNSLEDFFTSFILSVNVARQHYPNIHFYTDDYGVEFIEPYKNELNFTQVHNVLNEMDWLPVQWWAFPKLYVYSLQKEPFMHLDNDVYFWDKIPDNVKNEYDIICQGDELGIDHNYCYYDPYTSLEFHLPELLDFSKYKTALNAGTYGAFNKKGLNMFYDLYKTGIKVAKNILNDKYLKDNLDWDNTHNYHLVGLNMLIEQYYACIYSQLNNLKIYKIINGDWSAKELKYTHLIADAKRNPEMMEKLYKRVKAKKWTQK